ncbi:hypothetical protein K663_07260 [Sphingobium sp. MI1205]|nr:hypothetical protein K663_07260 [Sphingobium sp. MI1205]
MFMLLPIILQAASPPPPPVLHTVRTPPNFNHVAVESEKLPPVPVKVALYLGRETLWSGTLSVGSTPARLSLNEAVDVGSGCQETSYRGKSRNIELTLSRQPHRDRESFSLNARYSRPAQDGLCPTGSRQVSIDQQLSIATDSVTIEGDGGFRVVLTRAVH